MEVENLLLVDCKTRMNILCTDFPLPLYYLTQPKLPVIRVAEQHQLIHVVCGLSEDLLIDTCIVMVILCAQQRYFYSSV
jgi:hypothetical protein